ncbi:MAG: hypothetical protein GF350_01040 [Chitinivibrionales bacterium]|nr:hypothetical protein [Chitinivibrionales bacterium]
MPLFHGVYHFILKTIQNSLSKALCMFRCDPSKSKNKFGFIIGFVAVGWLIFIVVDTLMGITRSGYTIKMNKHLKRLYGVLKFLKIKALFCLIILNTILAVSAIMIGNKNIQLKNSH